MMSEKGEEERCAGVSGGKFGWSTIDREKEDGSTSEENGSERTILPCGLCHLLTLTR